MTNSSFFPTGADDWDFTTVWELPKGATHDGLPVLRWESIPIPIPWQGASHAL